MKMLCRITDEDVSNPWENEPEREVRSLESLTIGDLMGEDLDVWVTKSSKFGFRIEIDDNDGNIWVKEDEIHPVAADSFANFCRSYLSGYDRVSGDIITRRARNA